MQSEPGRSVKESHLAVCVGNDGVLDSRSWSVSETGALQHSFSFKSASTQQTIFLKLPQTCLHLLLLHNKTKFKKNK